MRYFLVTLIVSLLSSLVSAQSLISLQVDRSGEVFFVNSLSSLPQTFNGYSLLCTEDCLDVTGWNSISGSDTKLNSSDADGTATDADAAGASIFVEANPNSRTISELAVIDSAVLLPGTALSIGKPFAGTATQIDAWQSSGVLSARLSSDFEVWPISIMVVPEPAANLLLIGLSLLLVCFARRRRA